MKCNKCGKVFVKKNNCAVKINGQKVTVCPECGNEEIIETKKNRK